MNEQAQTDPATREILERIEEHVRCRLTGLLRDFQLVFRDNGFSSTRPCPDLLREATGSARSHGGEQLGPRDAEAGQLMEDHHGDQARRDPVRLSKNRP